MIHYLPADVDHVLVAWNMLHYAGNTPLTHLWHGTVAGWYVGGYLVGNTMYRMKYKTCTLVRIASPCANWPMELFIFLGNEPARNK